MREARQKGYFTTKRCGQLKGERCLDIVSNDSHRQSGSRIISYDVLFDTKTFRTVFLKRSDKGGVEFVQVLGERG